MSITVRELIEAYRSDPISRYHKLRYRTRVNVDGVLRRIAQGHGSTPLDTIKHRTIVEWHQTWSQDGVCLPMGHSMIAALRTITGFGLVFLEDKDCLFLRQMLREMKFPQGNARTQIITVEHIVALRELAHKEGCPSIALAQAIQFEGTFRQKDIIGEWVPYEEPGMSEVTSARYGKWLRGIRWNVIDNYLILVHVTSKKDKKVTVDLKLAPMAVDELRRQFPGCITKYQVRNKATGETRTELLVHRSVLPANGPVIVDEESGRPYLTHKFRRRWRELARAVGIPDDVQQRDTRATAMTEAAEAGADKDDIKESATHSDQKTTNIYIRGGASAKATARTMKVRATSRVKTA